MRMVQQPFTKKLLVLLLTRASLALQVDDEEIFSTSNCKTSEVDADERAKLGLPCVFPFIYRGKKYNGCTNATDPDELLWCATAVDENDRYITNSHQYGHCNADCPNHREDIQTYGIGSNGEVVDIQQRCEAGRKCVSSSKCPSYQEQKQELTTISASKSALVYQKKLQAIRDVICNYDEKGVCCPQDELKQDTLLASTAEPCGPKQSCVPLKECPKAQELIKVGTREAVDKVKSWVCNKETKAVCCDQAKACTAEAKDLTHPAYLPRAEKKECGGNLDSSRIVGGETTKPGTYPSAVLLGREEDGEEKDPFTGKFTGKKVKKLMLFCGGTLINRWYILTAAHCHNPDKPISRAVLGDWNTDPKIDPDCVDPYERTDCLPKRQVIHVEVGDTIVHEDYRKVARNVRSDIALVKLSAMAQLNEGVAVICLPLDSVYAAKAVGVPDLVDGMIGKRPEVVGWGYTNGDSDTQRQTSDFANGGSSASKLQQVLDVPVLPNSQCKEMSNYNLEDYQICAGAELGKDSCKGDSGGPLYMSKFSKINRIVPGNIWFLYGLVSFGSSNCGLGKPGVYTRVESFIPWIKEQLGAC